MCGGVKLTEKNVKQNILIFLKMNVNLSASK